MEIDEELKRGSGFENGKLRIYEFFLDEPTRKEAADFLKNEYGVGGRSGSRDPMKITSSSHDSKGIVLTKGGYGEDRVDKLIKWSEVGKRIRHLIDNDDYLTDEQMAQYEEQEHKKLMDDPTLLMNDAMKAATPGMYETESLALKDKTVQGIYFVPFRSSWTWYLVEYDDNTGDAFGLVAGDAVEWGYFNVRELHALGAQRLISHKPRTFEEIKDTELKNQLTSFELLNAFNGELRFKADEIKVDESIEIVNIQSEDEMEALGEVLEDTSGQVDQKLNIEKLDFKITDYDLGIGTSLEKLRNNIDAIKTLKYIESQDRLATSEEQEVLSKYIGWGGMPEVFDKDTNITWARTGYFSLLELLNEDEYRSARESTLNAHYTSPTIIEAMYDGLGILGFEKGNILEPSCGTGNFLGMLPEYFSESKFYGVELDSISGRIANQLYQNADIKIDGYENTTYSDSLFDVAIGNVPFGDYKVYDKRYEKENFLIHDYFFAKSLDKVREGGIVAFITSKGTLDKKNSKVRKYLAERAELLGAIRLPNTAFKANAGTEVTSDIIFLKKRERPMAIDEDWVHLNVNEDGISMNQYFIDHPEMVLGKMDMVSSRFGKESACLAIEGSSLKDQLAAAMNNLSGSIGQLSIEHQIENDNDEILADPTVRNYSFTIVDGEVYFRENSVMIKPTIKENDIPRLKGLIGIRDATRELVRLQMEDHSDEEIRAGQSTLNERYDHFTEGFGVINDKKNAKLFNNDVSYALICSLENIEHDTGRVTKADMFSKRTIKKRTVPEKVDSPIEALALSITEKAKVDMAYMASLTGLTADEVFEDLQGIVFKNPLYYEGGYEEEFINADEYLSGNVREKHEVAVNAAVEQPEVYSINASALELVIPKDLEATDIDVRLGATWLPVKDVEDFIFETLDTPGFAKWDINVRYSSFSANWNVEGKSKDRDNIRANMTFGTSRVSAYKIIEDTLNLKDTRVYDRVTDVDGKVKSVLNKHETMLAGQKQDAIKEAFKSWIWQEPSRRNRLVKMYNKKFNSTRPREFDGSHIAFDGMNPSISLREHQRNAIAHTLYGENTLLAHAVGAGKSFEMIASAMESKRLGLSQKSLFVVPNHLTEQMGSEFLKLYPSANILVSTKKDFEPKNRKKFCGRIATGDYDAVVIGHSQFERIPMSVERQQSEIERQIDAISDGIADLKANNGDNFSVKQLEKTKKSLSTRLLKLNDQSHKDDVVTFEELGVDRLIVDEAHSYKNLFLYTKMRNVAGIGQSEAKKSSDMFMKCRYMDEITNGKGIIFATGTPISNSMTELYTMQRYLQYGSLQKQRLEHFDAWASTFGETNTTIELSPEGTGYRPKTRFSKFYNLPELMNMFKEVADIKTADMLELPVPEAEFETVVIQPSEFQQEMVASLSERADAVRNKIVDQSTDNMLLITNDGRKLALDQRLMNSMLPRDDQGKVATCANNAFDIWQDTIPKKSTQLIFCDLSTPSGKSDFNVYDDIKEILIDKGVPSYEIAFIHDAKNEKQKDEMFAKVRSGDIRVLLGSTFKMGAGTNVQDKLIATHDLDCPWKPSDLEQRAGRLIRQGNENEKVKVFRYVTENTFDAFLWQLVENKQKFISQIMTSKSPVRSADDADENALSYAEIKALATGNPLIKEKMNLDVQVSKLKMLHSNYLSNKYALEDKIIKYYPNEIKRLETLIRGYKTDIDHVSKHTKTGLEGEKIFNGMTVTGITYGTLDKEAAGHAILTACKSVKDSKESEFGSYRGFDLAIKYDVFYNNYYAHLKGSRDHKVELGSDVYGNIARMDHVLDSMDAKLKDAELKLDAVRGQLKNAEVEVKKPFDKDKEMKEKVTRLSELDQKLNLAENEALQAPSELDRAKNLIQDYLEKEYEEEREPFDFDDLEKVDIAYTTTEDEKHEIQASVDLINFSVNTYIDDTLVNKEQYGTLKELNDYALEHLDYASLVFVEDEDIERIEDLIIDKDTDVDGVIDRFDVDPTDSIAVTNADIEENPLSDKRPSILGQLRKNQELIKGNTIKDERNNNVISM
ncbi:helicase [Acidaminobacter sp. JC074]|uniref:helicase-related protein n=1 Tax=Acidaminobacter sp. JC074 TaxID=2530199 RepID=UPI0021722F04|nr:helicase [Acidaminobacter sp. JC074]